LKDGIDFLFEQRDVFGTVIGHFTTDGKTGAGEGDEGRVDVGGEEVDY